MWKTSDEDICWSDKELQEVVCLPYVACKKTLLCAIPIGIAKGVQWVHLHPPGRWKKFFQA